MIARYDIAEQNEVLAAIGPIVDAHHHFWDLENHHYPWLQEAPVKAHFGDYSTIRRSFLPSDFLAALDGVNVVQSVHVEAHWRGGKDPVGETRWLSGLGDFPTAIVGHVDLLAADFEKTLAQHLEYSKFSGVRMMTRRVIEPSGSALLKDCRFRDGLRKCAAFGLCFDLQATAEMLKDAAELAKTVPEMTVVLTHAGLPIDRSVVGVALWRAGISEIAQQSNVSCKLSGLPMTDWAWTEASLAPFIDHLLHSFGPERLCFGSNFPVDGLFSSYRDLVTAYAKAVMRFEPGALDAVFRTTAQRLYQLPLHGADT